MPEDEEQNRIDRIRDGDAAAFAELVGQYEQAMLRTAVRIVGQHSDALEVRQTVLLRIWRQPEKLADARSIGVWIRRCVVNESIDLIRRREREPGLTQRR